ncbi:MAG: DUF4493 domain-containing protein [Clostridium sp.]|nr:DUF4493 domain-containing protein [Bacteroides sp.]MCM1198774.1 DUF4493 domain-containing protein [Clostridium sp.]
MNRASVTIGKCFVAWLSLCLAASCTGKFALDTQTEAGYGYVGFDLRTDDDMVVVPIGKSVPDDQLAAYTIEIVDKETSTMVRTMKYGDVMSSPVAIAPGSYRVYAENCTVQDAEQGNGCMRIAGEYANDLDIAVDEVRSVVIGCSVANAKLSVSFSEPFLEEVESYTMLLEDDGRTITVGSSGQYAESWWNIGMDGKRFVQYRLEAFRRGVGEPAVFTGAFELEKAVWLKVNVTRESQTESSSQRISFSSVREIISPIRSEAF